MICGEIFKKNKKTIPLVPGSTLDISLTWKSLQEFLLVAEHKVGKGRQTVNKLYLSSIYDFKVTITNTNQKGTSIYTFDFNLNAQTIHFYLDGLTKRRLV